MGVLTPRRPDAPRAIRATCDCVRPVVSATLLLIWSSRLSVSPNCSKLLDVEPLLLRDDRSLATPFVNASASTDERSLLAATASLRAASTCRLASCTSCSDTRIDTTREA